MIELTVNFLLELGTVLVKAYGKSLQEEDLASARPGAPPPALDLAPLVASLEGLQSSTDEIVDVLKHPSRTASNEMLDRASYAFKRGLYEEAQRDATESVRLFPYRPDAQLIRAISSLAVGDAEATVAALSDTVRYAVDEDLPIGCTAALIAANLADASDARQVAIEGLQAFRQQSHDRFPEILLALHLRIPDDDACLAALVGALIGMGLDLDDPSDRVRGITAQLDAFLEPRASSAADVQRSLREVALRRTSLDAAGARELPTDERFLAFVTALDGVDLRGRTSISAGELVGGYAPAGMTEVDAAERLRARADLYESLHPEDMGSLARDADLPGVRTVIADYAYAAEELRAATDRLDRATAVASAFPTVDAAPGPLLRAAYRVPLSVAPGQVRALPELPVTRKPRAAAKRTSRSGGATGTATAAGAPKAKKTKASPAPDPKVTVTSGLVERRWVVDIQFGTAKADHFILVGSFGEQTRYERNGSELTPAGDVVSLGAHHESRNVKVAGRGYRIVQNSQFRWFRGSDVVVSVLAVGGRVLATHAFKV